MTWRDRIRLDVALVEGREMFAWRGSAFEAKEVGELVPNGSSGSGDFISFVTSVFGSDTETIRYRGTEDNLAVFDYTVPLAKSHYLFHSHGGEKTAGYHGSFFVEAGSAQLRRLTIRTDPFPEEENACEVEDTLEYRTQVIGTGEFLLPELATMRVLFRDGEEAHNETRYANCREYVGQSTIRFDEAEEAGSRVKPAASPRGPLPPLTSGVRLKIALSEPINTATAAAGDAVLGLIVGDVKGRKSGVVAHSNDRVRGRILRMEQSMYPSPRWIVRLRFDAIERNGETRAVNLKQRGNGTDGTFVFPSRGDIMIDRNFQTEWETR